MYVHVHNKGVAHTTGMHGMYTELIKRLPETDLRPQACNIKCHTFLAEQFSCGKFLTHYTPEELDSKCNWPLCKRDIPQRAVLRGQCLLGGSGSSDQSRPPVKWSHYCLQLPFCHKFCKVQKNFWAGLKSSHAYV